MPSLDGGTICPVALRNEPGSSDPAIIDENAALVVYATIRESWDFAPVFEELGQILAECFRGEGWEASGGIGDLQRTPTGKSTATGDLAGSLHVRQLMFLTLLVSAQLADDEDVKRVIEQVADLITDEIDSDKESVKASIRRSVECSSTRLSGILGRRKGAVADATDLCNLLAVLVATNLTRDEFVLVDSANRARGTKKSEFTVARNELGLVLALNRTTFAAALRLRTARPDWIVPKGRTRATSPQPCNSVAEGLANVALSRSHPADCLNRMLESGLDRGAAAAWRRATRAHSHLWCDFFIAMSAALAEVEGSIKNSMKELSDAISTAVNSKYPVIPKVLVSLVASALLSHIGKALGTANITVARHLSSALALLLCPDPDHHNVGHGHNTLDESCATPLFRDYASTAVHDQAKGVMKERIDSLLAQVLATV